MSFECQLVKPSSNICTCSDVRSMLMYSRTMSPIPIHSARATTTAGRMHPSSHTSTISNPRVATPALSSGTTLRTSWTVTSPSTVLDSDDDDNDEAMTQEYWATALNGSHIPDDPRRGPSSATLLAGVGSWSVATNSGSLNGSTTQAMDRAVDVDTGTTSGSQNITIRDRDQDQIASPVWGPANPTNLASRATTTDVDRTTTLPIVSRVTQPSKGPLSPGRALQMSPPPSPPGRRQEPQPQPLRQDPPP